MAARLAAILALATLLGAPVKAETQDQAPQIASARLILPTDRYDHAVLGDALEWGGLELVLTDGTRLRITLPKSRVFEDVEARLGDFDGDGRTEVMVVETDIARGAALAIYDASGKRGATAPIGQTHRWLAPSGWGDFDGDGRIEIAYVDRPHLARELVLLRLDGTRLTEIARMAGLTNHRIGDARIQGGLRRCAGRDSLILANATWSEVLEVTWNGKKIEAHSRGPLRRDTDLDAARRCR